MLAAIMNSNYEYTTQLTVRCGWWELQGVAGIKSSL